jgi:hypothetical protein
MENQNCQLLAKRFEQRKAEGLVDVKFYLRNLDEATVDHVCGEVNALYDAMEREEYAPLDFKDGHS